MNQHKNTFRLTALLTVVAIILGIYVFRLQNVQIAQAKAAKNVRTDTYTYYTRVTAARGELLDCKGKVLIGNRASFNVVLINPVLFSAEKPNELLRRLTNLCNELGLELNDHFPVSQTKPYTYTTDDYPSKWKDYFKKFLAAREWDSDISAPQLVLRMRERYNIPDDWTEEEARRVISVRYELDLRYCTNLPTYVLIEDIDSTSLAELTELNIPGMNVETSTVREYHTTLAAHILGYVGDMNRQQYEEYEPKGYAMDAQVGQAGLELAFEEQLHGTDGLRETTIDSKGNVIEEHYVQEPVAGNNVELTLDLDLQQVAEKALEDKILQLRETGSSSGTGKDAEGGAVVVQVGRVHRDGNVGHKHGVHPCAAALKKEGVDAAGKKEVGVGAQDQRGVGVLGSVRGDDFQGALRGASRQQGALGALGHFGRVGAGVREGQAEHKRVGSRIRERFQD